MREGRSKSRERHQTEAEMHTPGPGGGGGRLNEEAHQAAAENRKSWTGQRQRRKSEGWNGGTVERWNALVCAGTDRRPGLHACEALHDA